MIDYVALGHLHKPQKVQHPHIRYSGSPIPLSFSEINYKHQVVEVKIEPSKADQSAFQFETLPVPRSIQLHRVRGELNEVFNQLKAMADGEIANIDQREYIDIEYHTDTPPLPNLRQQFEDALPKNRYRLVKISRQYKNLQVQNCATKIQLEPPTPEKLFEQIWQNKGYVQDDAVLKDFQSLVQEAHQSLENKNTI